MELVSEDGTSRTVLVENRDWQHPRSVWPKGGIRLAKGRKLRVTCTWHNSENRTVRFGPETTDEMCFGIGFFYRDPGDSEPVIAQGMSAVQERAALPRGPGDPPVGTG